MPDRFDPETVQECYDALIQLHKDAVAIEADFSKALSLIPETYRGSAENLLHYIALRRRDIRHLQIQLGYLGLSSLGRLEAHVLAGIESVLRALYHISGKTLANIREQAHPSHFKEGDAQLALHTDQLLGPKPQNRNVRIMVTLPSEAAQDAALIQNLMVAGMDVARINTAHDTSEDWGRMVENIRRAESVVQRKCRILMDLCGPKLRTGAIAPKRKKKSKSKSKPPAITLAQGDVLIITPPDKMGHPAETDSRGKRVKPACIPCTLPQIFKDVQEGHRIFFDDGEIAGVISGVSKNELKVNITRTQPGGKKLRSDKGINLPDSILRVPALSENDLRALDFGAQHADIMGLSFVREPEDIRRLHKEMQKRTDRTMGVILKIETRHAFENLPRLLLSGLQNPPLGVMVARGDLGVEVGFERMAEVQEQILWLCEAAHTPVIWATQVLEQMNKNGMPTRGEVTDAAVSARAECVMLNKGPYVVQTVAFLRDILVRMQDHHHKKTPMLRRLKVSEGRWQNEEAPSESSAGPEALIRAVPDNPPQPGQNQPPSAESVI